MTDQFDQLMAGIMSNDNEIRKMAEDEYQKISIQQKGTSLFNHYLNASANVESRSMALVLFRRLISSNSEDFWHSVGKVAQDDFHRQIIKCVAEEKEVVLKKRLGDILSELARDTVNEDSGEQEWTEILQFLEICATTEDANLREIGMSLIENVPNVFGSNYTKYLNGIKQMFHSSLLYGADSSVRTAAVRAYVAFVVDNEENDDVVRSLSDLVPAVIQVCQHVVATEDEDDVPLQCLGDLATSLPKLLIPHINDIFTLCLSTIADAQKDDSYRHSSLEVMVSFCESSPNFMRKRGASYLPSLIQQCLHMMTELDEELSEWMEMDDAEDDIDEENAGIGETSLDRIAVALGGKSMLQPTLQYINELLKNEDWKCRHAGVMALSTIGEGCKRQMEPVVHEILNSMILPRIAADEHPRVRYAACNAIGQMCTDFAPTMQKKCHERIVPALLLALVDLSTPRVAAHAGAAIVNFSEHCPKNIISIYLPSIMEKMEYVLNQTFQQLMVNGKKIVLEQIITSIASVADAAETNFTTYYNKLMPPLKYILENATTEKLRLLRGKAIECISLIGMAVGPEVFRADAHQIMKLIPTTDMNFECSSDDPQVSYVISAWARICKTLGTEFAQYLEAVMPAVITAADYKPDMQIFNDEQANDEDEEWNYISLGDERSLGIRTAGLEDKVTACEMIVCYARELGASFAPYVERVKNLMIPLLRCMFHDGVRTAAAECLPALLVCADSFGEEYVKHLWRTIFEAYKDAIDKEPDLDVISELLNGVSQCIETHGKMVMTNQDVQDIFAISHEQLKRLEKRRAERERASRDEEPDEEDQEQLEEIAEQEGTLLSKISDIVHNLFIAFEQQLLPFFDQMVPQFATLLDPRRPYQDRQWGICMFDDVIEFCGEMSFKYHQIFIEPFVLALGGTYPEVIQAAAYGCGLMGMKGGPVYAQICAQILQPLAAAIGRPNARSTEEDMSATENAISAVAKILKYNSSAISVNEVIPTFISWLPIWNDLEEVPHVYAYFCDLVEANNPFVLGTNNAGLGRIFEIVLFTFTHGVFEEETAELQPIKQRLVNIIKMIKNDDALFQNIVNSANLNAHQRQVLMQILS